MQQFSPSGNTLASISADASLRCTKAPEAQADYSYAILMFIIVILLIILAIIYHHTETGLLQAETHGASSIVAEEISAAAASRSIEQEL
mgnify:CR=1 FL=1